MHAHINTYYQNELDNVRNQIIKMAEVVSKQLKRAHKSMFNNDLKLAEEIHKQDKNVNIYRDNIESIIIQIIATRQPMANDLRFLISSLRIIDEIERIGDYADNMTNHIELLDNISNDISLILSKIEKMLLEVTNMFNDIIRSFEDKKSDLAKKVVNKDDDIDSKHSEVLSSSITLMMKEKGIADKVTELIYISKICERIGDRVFNIGTKVYYLIEGSKL